MTEEEVAKLDGFEGYPRVYNRVQVKLVAHIFDPVTKEVKDEEIDGEVYTKNDNSKYLGVYEPYLEACCKTLLTH